MSGGSITSFDSTTYRAYYKFHRRIGTQATVLRKRSPSVEVEREAERSVTRPPRLETLRQYSVQCVKARTHPQPDNVSRKRIDFGVAHDAVGKLGVATVPGVELAETATQPLLGIGNPTQGVRIRQRIALQSQPGAGEKQFAPCWEMCVDRMTLHARALGNSADARARRSPCGMQVNGRLDNAPTGFRLVLRAPLQGIGSFSIHCTALYSHIDSGQEINYT